MKNITKSVKIISRVIDLLLGSDSATPAEKSLTDLKNRYIP
jgi:hypothetical protein